MSTLSITYLESSIETTKLHLNVNDDLQSKNLLLFLPLNLLNTLTYQLYLMFGTGETSMAQIASLGPETNTFLSTVAAAGPMQPPPPSPTESTSPETELGPI